MPKFSIKDLLIMNQKKSEERDYQWTRYATKSKNEETKRFIYEMILFKQELQKKELQSIEAREEFHRDLNKFIQQCKELVEPKADDDEIERKMKSDLLKFGNELEKDSESVLDSINAEIARKNLKIASAKDEYVKAFSLMDKIDPPTVISSKEYREIKKSIKAINKLLVKANDPLDDAQLEKMNEYCQRINNLSESYISMKADKVASGKKLKPLEEKRLEAMKVMQKSFNAQLRATNAALGKKTVTSRQMADELNRKADDILSKEQLKDKPDKKLIRKAIAIRKFADQLQTKPEDHIYNAAMTESSIDKIMSSKDFSAIAEKEFDELGIRFAKQTREQDIKAKDQSFFFTDGTSVGRFDSGATGRFALSVGRDAMNMLATAQMLKKGYTLKEIYSSPDLANERHKAGAEVLEYYDKLDDASFKKWVSELIHDSLVTSLNEMNEAVSKLPEITGKTLTQPENAYITPTLSFLQSLGQEYAHPEIKSEIFNMYGEKEVLGLIDQQMGLTVPLSQIVSNQLKALDLSEISGPKATPSNLQTGIVGMFTKAAVEKNVANVLKSGSNEPFSNLFSLNNHPENALKVMNLNGTIAPSTERFCIDVMNQFKPDMQGNIQNLGTEILKGKIFTKNDIVKCEDGEFMIKGGLQKQLKELSEQNKILDNKSMNM